MGGQRLFMVSGSDQFQILGTPLLNQHYGVFDKSGQKVGFANLKGCSSSWCNTASRARCPVRQRPRRAATFAPRSKAGADHAGTRAREGDKGAFLNSMLTLAC